MLSKCVHMHTIAKIELCGVPLSPCQKRGVDTKAAVHVIGFRYRPTSTADVYCMALSMVDAVNRLRCVSDFIMKDARY